MYKYIHYNKKYKINIFFLSFEFINQNNFFIFLFKKKINIIIIKVIKKIKVLN
jgi:hypothetical protein